MAKENPTTKKVLRIGHRGAAGHATENTLRSIEEAIALRCDLIEVDVRRTRDGALVLLHDERVDRTTNGKGAVAEMTLKDLLQVYGNVGGWLSATPSRTISLRKIGTSPRCWRTRKASWAVF